MTAPNIERIRIGLVLLLLLLAGCGDQSSWKLDINDLQVEQHGDIYRISGELAIGGFTSEVEVHDAQLVLTDEDDGVIERIPIGQLDGNSTRRTVKFNQSISTVPHCIFIRYGSLQEPPGDGGQVAVHLQIDGGYDLLYRSPDDPYQSCQVVLNEYARIMTENQ